MSLLLVSHPLCPYVHRATAFLSHKRVAYDVKYVDLTAKPDWFLKLSPRGKVPVLVANEIPLFESAAILEFLDETNPPHIVPADPYERARQRAWIEVANDLFTAHYKLTIAPTGEIEAASKAITAVLARFADDLRGPYFAGDTIGIVDFATAPALFRLRLLDRAFGTHLLTAPKIAAWSELVATLPSVTGGVPEDFEARWRTSLAERGTFKS